MLVKGLLTQMSGSLGGITASHNKGGLYLRSRSIPTNPNTFRQQSIRAVFNDLVQRFNSELTPAERAAWLGFSQNLSVLGPLGDARTISPLAWYVKSNAAREYARLSGLTGAGGLSIIDAPTGPTNTGEQVTTISLAETDGTDFTVTGNLSADASAAGVALLFVGPTQNPDVNFFKGPYQLAAAATFALGATAVQFTGDETDGAEWATNRLPQADTRMPMRIVLLYADGRVSQDYREIIEWTAAAP